MVRLIPGMIALVAFSSSAAAQDPVKADPAHHTASVVTYLTDAHTRVSPVGGKPNETPRKAKDVIAIEPTRHTVENIGSKRVELILVELKAGTAAPR